MLSAPAPIDVRVGGERPAAPSPAEPPRLQWLDGLRGIAVLAVVAAHLTELVFREIRPEVLAPWFDSGKYGVMVFFLVSGYIIPASLDRHGSVGRFWIGRAFRLYPLLAVAIASMLLLGVVGLGRLDRRVGADPVTAAAAHLTLLQDVLGVRPFLNVLWTLSYEMVFYLLVTALFIMGMRRRGAEIALGFGLAAALLAPVLPAVLLPLGAGNARWTVGAVAIMLVLGLACAVRTGRASRAVGAALLGGLAVALLVFNQRGGMWEGLVILAVMFTGTAIYRVERGGAGAERGGAGARRGDTKARRGGAGWPRSLVICLAVWALALVAGVWNMRLWQVAAADPRGYGRGWVVTIALTGATFAVAWLLRRRRFPRALVWVGTVSYSIYLMHTVLLAAFHRVLDPDAGVLPLAAQAGVAAVYLCLLAAVAWTTYRYVEAPGQRFGRRLARLLPRTSPHAQPDLER
jgi:peptidoglycan/LPS O-acetylase OafA/YrhL